MTAMTGIIKVEHKVTGAFSLRESKCFGQGLACLVIIDKELFSKHNFLAIMDCSHNEIHAHE